MTTCTVTGTIHRSDDTPWFAARIGFSLVSGTSTMEVTYPEDGLVTTAADGTFAVELTSGLDTPYRCTLPDGDSFLFELPSGSPDPVSIEVLRATYAPPSNEPIRTIIDINTVVSVTAGSTSLVPATVNRGDTLIWNQGSLKIYVAFGVTATTAGFPLAAGASMVVTTTQAINARSHSGTQSVFVLSEVHPA